MIKCTLFEVLATPFFYDHKPFYEGIYILQFILIFMHINMIIHERRSIRSFN